MLYLLWLLTALAADLSLTLLFHCPILISSLNSCIYCTQWRQTPTQSLALSCSLQFDRYFSPETKLCVYVLKVAATLNIHLHALPIYNKRRKTKPGRSKDTSAQRQSKKAEQSSGRWEESQEAFAQQETKIFIPCCVRKHKESERRHKRENDSATQPTTDLAKMLIMPETLPWCQNPSPFLILGNWPIH